jgi:hypothetical protein
LILDVIGNKLVMYRDVFVTVTSSYLPGHSEKDLHSVLSYLKQSFESKPAPLDPDFEPEELKDEL